MTKAEEVKSIIKLEGRVDVIADCFWSENNAIGLLSRPLKVRKMESIQCN